jgi:toluene monooxygenase system protein D
MSATTTTTIGNGYKNNRVGPVIRACDISRAVIDAAREDNPDRDIVVDDQMAYVRIYTDSELILRRVTLEEALGRPFQMAELELNLATFAGQIETSQDQVRFYLNKTL